MIETTTSPSPSNVVEFDGGTTWTAVLQPLRLDVNWVSSYNDKLDSLLSRAQSSDTWEKFNGRAWRVLPRAIGSDKIHYRWSLESPVGVVVSIHQTPHPKLRSLRVNIRARALRSLTFEEVDEMVSDLLAAFNLRYTDQTYSRLDVNLTTKNTDWSIARFSSKVDEGAFTSKFRDRRPVIKGKFDYETLTFGRLPGVQFCCYDKIAELKSRMRSKDVREVQEACDKHFHLLRALGSELCFMYRYEWRLNREWLRKHHINTTSDLRSRLPEAFPDVFNLFRLLDHAPSRGNSSRVKTLDWWQGLVNAFCAGVSALCLRPSSTEHNKHLPHKDLRPKKYKSLCRSTDLKTAACFLYRAFIQDKVSKLHNAIDLGVDVPFDVDFAQTVTIDELSNWLLDVKKQVVEMMAQRDSRATEHEIRRRSDVVFVRDLGPDKSDSFEEPEGFAEFARFEPEESLEGERWTEADWQAYLNFAEEQLAPRAPLLELAEASPSLAGSVPSPPSTPAPTSFALSVGVGVGGGDRPPL